MVRVHRDVTGQQFGELTAIKSLGKNKHGIALWRCQCKCGAFTDVTISNLGRDHTRSCGQCHPKYRDITNQLFGKLTAIERVGSTKGQSIWRCRCQCGGLTDIRIDRLISGDAIGCGEGECHGNLRHGHNRIVVAESPTHSSWDAMIQRCTNPNATNFDKYGGRGITICARWRKFENFLADMGERPDGTSIDRINNDKGYFKSNCRWATPKEQTNNRRCSNAREERAA